MIKVLALDVDGTLTDGSIHISNDGELFKTFNVKDGYGIRSLIDSGVIVVIITGRESNIVENRARELKIQEVYQNVVDKAAQLKEVTARHNLSMGEVAYIGDDLNDLECIRIASLSFAPNDAVDAIKDEVDIVTSNCAGHGAVRECCDYIIRKNTGEN